MSPDMFGHARSSGHANLAISTPCYLYMSLRDEILQSCIPHLLDAPTSRKALVFWRVKRAKSWLVVLVSRHWQKLSSRRQHRPPKNHTKMFTAVTYKKDAGHTRAFHCCLPLVPAAYRARPPEVSFWTQLYRVSSVILLQPVRC